MSREDVRIDKGEFRAIQRGVEMFKECALHGESSLEQANQYLNAYAKLAEKLVSQIQEGAASLRRAEEMTKAVVTVVKEQGTPELKAQVAVALREIAPLAEYQSRQEPYAHQNLLDSLKSRVADSSAKWDQLISPDLGKADALSTSLNSIETKFSSPPSLLEGSNATLRPVNPNRTAGTNSSTMSVSVPPMPSMTLAPRSASPPQLRSPRYGVPALETEEDEESAALQVEEFHLAPTPKQPKLLTPTVATTTRVSVDNGVDGKALAASPNSMKKASASLPYDSDIDGESTQNDEPSPVSLQQMIADDSKNNTPKVKVEEATTTTTTATTPATPAATVTAPSSAENTPPGSKNTSSSVIPAASPTSPSATDSEKKKKPTTERKKTLTSFFGTLRKRRSQDLPEMVISGPMDVQHAAHIGPDDTLDESKVKKIASEVLEKQRIVAAAAEPEEPEPASNNNSNNSSNNVSGSTPTAASTPTAEKEKGGKKKFLTLRPRKKEESSSTGAAAEEDSTFEITGPTEVAHQGHVDVNDAQKGDAVAAVSDAIDSVANKAKPVDVENVYAEEIAFAEEYNPDL